MTQSTASISAAFCRDCTFLLFHVSMHWHFTVFMTPDIFIRRHLVLLNSTKRVSLVYTCILRFVIQDYTVVSLLLLKNIDYATHPRRIVFVVHLYFFRFVFSYSHLFHIQKITNASSFPHLKSAKQLIFSILFRIHISLCLLIHLLIFVATSICSHKWTCFKTIFYDDVIYSFHYTTSSRFLFLN